MVAAGVIALAPAAPAAAAPFGCTDDMYFASANTITRRAADGTLTPISTGTLDPFSIALNPIDGNLYAFPNDVVTGNHLFRVEADGTSTDLGAIAGLPAGLQSFGGFDDSGVLWTESTGSLYGIDVASMTAATPLPLSANVYSDFAFVDGLLYAATGAPFAPDLARVDRATGAVTAIDLPGMTAICVAPPSSAAFIARPTSTADSSLSLFASSDTSWPCGRKPPVESRDVGLVLSNVIAARSRSFFSAAVRNRGVSLCELVDAPAEIREIRGRYSTHLSLVALTGAEPELGGTPRPHKSPTTVRDWTALARSPRVELINESLTTQG